MRRASGRPPNHPRGARAQATSFAIAELIESISGRSSQGISETGIDTHGAHARVRTPLVRVSHAQLHIPMTAKLYR